MSFNEINYFAKDFKRLSKKYKSLPEDLLEFKKVISKFPLGRGKHFIILTTTEAVKIVKARLFCRYLRGSSLRIVYAYFKAKQIIEFIEIYPKSEKEREDQVRIKDYLNNIRN